VPDTPESRRGIEAAWRLLAPGYHVVWRGPPDGLTVDEREERDDG
jgi:hypothetical protein